MSRRSRLRRGGRCQSDASPSGASTPPASSAGPPLGSTSATANLRLASPRRLGRARGPASRPSSGTQVSITAYGAIAGLVVSSTRGGRARGVGLMHGRGTRAVRAARMDGMNLDYFEAAV